MKEYYLQKAYLRLGVNEKDWNPTLGFKQNLPILHKLYYYYQQIYFLEPQLFLWMGLARLTGGQVLWGMSNLVKVSKDPSVLTQQIVFAEKAIFENLAWQHEFYLDNPTAFINYLQNFDKENKHTHSYKECWQLIASGEKENIEKGNLLLLENEQYDTIQHHYDIIKKDSYSKKYFWFTKFIMRKIHQYHNRFIWDVPFGDVTNFNPRWKWITHKKGMWNTWINTLLEERNRLISLSNEDVMFHKWQNFITRA